MYRKQQIIFLIVMLCGFFINNIHAQSIPGKIIYVSLNAEVRLKFSSDITRSSFNITGENNSFIYTTGMKNINVRARIENFEPTILSIDEGKNTHTFMLVYKEVVNFSALVYDYSDKKKLAAEVDRLTKNPDTLTPPVNDPAPPTADVIKPALPIDVTRKNSSLTQQEKDDKYSEIKAEANHAAALRKFDEAIDLYTKAMIYRPDDPFCLERIEKMKKDKDDLAKQAQIEELKKLKKQSYQKHVDIAKQAMSNKDYAMAKDELNSALNDQPGDYFALSQIKEIDILIAREQYDKYMGAGKNYLAAKLYDEALASFSQALTFRNGDAEAIMLKSTAIKQKQDDIENIRKQQTTAAEEKRYRDAVAAADQLFESGQLDAAKTAYKKLNSLDAHVAGRIKTIEALQAEAINKAAYDKVIAEADKAFAAKDYTKAIALYVKADGLMPGLKYAQGRLSDIKIIQDDIEKNKQGVIAKEIEQKKKDAEFKQVLKDYDIAIKNNDFVTGKSLALRATELKPADSDARKKLEYASAKNQEKETEDNFYELMQKGDAASLAGDLEGALKFYNAAKDVIPSRASAVQKSIMMDQQIYERDSLAIDQKNELKRNEDFKAGKKEYDKADLARKEKRYAEAYTGYSNFLNKIDMRSLDRYGSTRSYYINQAGEFLKNLEPYKPLSTSVVDIKEKYPDIDFSKPPQAQGFSKAALDFEKQTQFITKNVLPLQPHTNITSSVGKLKLSLELIYFKGQIAYFRFNIKNSGTEDFLTGPMLLSMVREGGRVNKILPVFVSGFPVVQPGEEKMIVYTAKELIVVEKDYLMFEMRDRRDKTKISLNISSTNYYMEQVH